MTDYYRLLHDEIIKKRDRHFITGNKPGYDWVSVPNNVVGLNSNCVNLKFIERKISHEQWVAQTLYLKEE